MVRVELRDPVKLLHVILSLAPRYEGPGQAVRAMCRALAKYGQEITVFTTNVVGSDDLDRNYIKNDMNLSGEEITA